MTGTLTSTAAPERARWPRLAAAPQPPLRSLLPRGYAGFTEATTPRHLILPASTAVSLVVKILDSPYRPPAFVMGAHGSSSVVEGDCAPSYLEVWLAPLGAYTLLGLPMEELSGQLVDLVDVLGAAGAWIGIDVIVAVLVLAGRFGDDVAVRSLAYQALATFVVWPMLTAGLVCLATGLILGMATTWGLLRYWWVAVKLALNLVLCTLIVLVLQPGMDEVAGYGRDLLTGSPDPGTVSTLFFPPAVSLTTLTLATTLAVFKPWGRIRPGRSGGDRP